jgi:hypothetical protein
VFDQKISGVSYINRSCCNFFFDVKEVYVSVLCSIEKITGSIILVHSEFVHICFDVVDMQTRCNFKHTKSNNRHRVCRRQQTMKISKMGTYK